MKQASIRLGISKREIRDKEVAIKKDTRRFAAELQRLLNFNLPQSQINLLMDELVQRAIIYDLRGPAVDLLFFLKERRDERTNMMLKSKIDRKQVELSIFEKEPLYILKNDLEQAEKTKHYEQTNENDLDFMGLHPLWLNYEKVSELTRLQLLQAASTEIEGKKDIIGLNKKQRALFILSEPFTHIFNILKIDKLLRISRAICRYRFLKGSCGSVFYSFEEEVEILLKNQQSIDSIEANLIKTAREYIDTERSKLNTANIHQSGEKIRIDPDHLDQMADVSDNVPLIREKKLVLIKHAMDRLEGVGQSSIQKMPLGLNISEYNLGLVINSYILKITRLDILKHPSLIVEMVQKLLKIGRGQNRIEQGDSKTELEFIVNEIYLNLIRYINTQLDQPERQKLYNGINLLALLSYFLKPSAEISLYCMHIYSKLILPALNELKEDHSAKIKNQSVTLLENLLDYLKTDKFCLYHEQFKVYFFNYGSVLVDLFDGPETDEITFRLKIVAKKKVEQEVTCRKNKMVWEFMKDVSLISELFEELDLESGLFWLYIETEQEDIPLEFDMPMSRVHHLMLFVNLCEPSNELKLVVKLRIYSVRQKLSMAGITGPILNCVYQQTLKNYMGRNWFHGYLKSSQIVEVAAIFHIIRSALDDKEYEKLCRVYGYPLEQIIPKKSLPLHSEQEWKLKIESYLNKNAYLKKQKVSILKRKFMEYLLYSPGYSSNIYRYRVYGEGSLLLKNEGILVISVFGIYLYEESSFKKPKVYIEFEDLQNMEIRQNHVSIEFIEEKTQTVKTLCVHSPMKNDIAYDIVSYMQIQLKESKNLYYSYNFLQQYLTEGKSMGQVNFDPVTQMYVSKCLEEISHLKDAVLVPGNLAFTKNYNEEIPAQSLEDYSNMTFGRGFSIQSQRSLAQTVEILKMKGELDQFSKPKEVENQEVASSALTNFERKISFARNRSASAQELPNNTKTSQSTVDIPGSASREQLSGRRAGIKRTNTIVQGTNPPETRSSPQGVSNLALGRVSKQEPGSSVGAKTGEPTTPKISAGINMMESVVIQSSLLNNTIDEIQEEDSSASS